MSPPKYVHQGQCDDPLILPTQSLRHKPHSINKPYQHRHLNQRPHSRRKSLVTIRPKRRNSNRNGQLKVIACCSKALCRRQLVPKAQFMRDKECGKKNNNEVNNKRSSNTHNRHNLMHHSMTLRSKKHQDSEQQANQGPRADPFQENLVIPPRTGNPAKDEAGEDCSAKWDSKEYCNARGGGGIFKVDWVATDNVDEEDSHGGEEDHLEEGVDSN